MFIKMKTTGNLKRTRTFLEKSKKVFTIDLIEPVAITTVKRLEAASPDKKVAQSWSYRIEEKDNVILLYFDNSYVVNGSNVAIIIENGHATKTGKWIVGTKYIEQPIKEAYEEIIHRAMEELNKV